MVTQDADSLESRPPELKDLVFLAKALNEAGVKYVVIGGIAMIQQGFVRATEDIDLLLDDHLGNLASAIAAVGKLPDRAALQISPEEFQEFEVIRVADEIVVDLMIRASQLKYVDAQHHLVWVELEGVKIPFGDTELLLQMKQGIREKDVLDRRFLEARLAEMKKP